MVVSELKLKFDLMNNKHPEQQRYTLEPSRARAVVEPQEKRIKHFIIHEASDGNFYMTKGICFRKLSLLVDYYLVIF